MTNGEQQFGKSSGGRPVMTHTRWLWLLLPVAIVLAFNKLIVLTLTLWHQMSGGIAPWVFFLLPFLSVLPPLLLLAIWHWRQRRDPGLRIDIYTRDTLASDAGLGAIAGVLCIAVFVGSLKVLRLLGVAAPDFSSLTPMHHLFFSTVGALIPGICEELFFRGFLMARFRDLRPTLLLALTGASFSLWHVLSPSYLLHTFIIGLILGGTVLRTRRLLPAIVAHSLANASAGLIIVMGLI